MTRQVPNISPHTLAINRTREHHIRCWYGMNPRVRLCAGGVA